MEDVLTRKEHMGFHDEFVKRIDAENERQNRRISLLEDNARQFTTLTVSLEKITVTTENMLKELEKQGERLEKLEMEPAESQKQVKMAIITAIISTVVGAAIGALIMIL